MTLVISVLKGDKMDDVVRDAVMLGVGAIQPVVSERAETSLATMARSGRVARWQRIAVSSAKQCGRAVVPPIHARDAARVVLERATDAPRLDCCVSSRRRRLAMCVPCKRLHSHPPLHADRRARGRLVGDGNGGGPRFWRYPDVTRRAHVARGRGADRGLDGVAHYLG